jgi:hypothetical protein
VDAGETGWRRLQGEERVERHTRQERRREKRRKGRKGRKEKEEKGEREDVPLESKVGRNNWEHEMRLNGKSLR